MTGEPDMQAMSRRAPIFIITGAPGAGKSSVAVALVQRFPFGLHVAVDDLREWVVSGIAQPVPVWTAETSRQFRLARQAAAQIARLYASAGFAVAIDDVIAPAETQELFETALPGYVVHKVLLRPALEVALRRNTQRANKSFDTSILDDVIRGLHTSIDEHAYAQAGWLVIDNGALGVVETVDTILGCVATGSLPGPKQSP